MSIKQFLCYVQFSRDCPERIDATRWDAMLRWLDARSRLSEPPEWAEHKERVIVRLH